jgi:hypothetical protein
MLGSLWSHGMQPEMSVMAGAITICVIAILLALVFKAVV